MPPASAHQPPLRICIVEDDDDLRSHLAQLIATVPDMVLAGQFARPDVAAEAIPGLRPEVVLMDINLPAMNGIECARLIRPKLPSAQILMLTVYEDSDLIFQSLKPIFDSLKNWLVDSQQLTKAGRGPANTFPQRFPAPIMPLGSWREPRPRWPESLCVPARPIDCAK